MTGIQTKNNIILSKPVTQIILIKYMSKINVST